jgi:hypothetical protein
MIRKKAGLSVRLRDGVLVLAACREEEASDGGEREDGGGFHRERFGWAALVWSRREFTGF